MPHKLLEVECRIQALKGKPLDVKDIEGIKKLRAANIEQYEAMAMQNREIARENDSDDGGNGYDSCSSGDAHEMMMHLESLEQENPDVVNLDQSIQITEVKDEELLNKEEMQNQFLKMTTKMSSAKNMRKFLGGIQLHLEA